MSPTKKILNPTSSRVVEFLSGVRTTISTIKENEMLKDEL